jgi:DNA-binding beta-propeller fold protein YncE
MLKTLIIVVLSPLMVLQASAAIITFNPGGNGPVDIAVSLDGQTGYVACGKDHSVTVVRLTDFVAVDTVPVGYDPLGVELTSDGQFLYVPNTVNGYYTTKIDANTHQVLANIPGGTDPGWVAFTPDGTTACITSNWSSFLQLVDVSTNSEIGRVSGIANGGYGVVVTADGQYAYVVARSVGPSAGTGVYKVSLLSRTVVDVIPVTGMRGLSLTPDGSELWVPALGGTGVVYIISTASGTVIDSVVLGGQPWDIVVASDGQYAYVVDNANSYVYQVNISMRTAVSRIPVGLTPEHISFNNDQSRIYVCSPNGNNVTAIDVAEFGMLWCDDFECSGSSCWTTKWHGSGNVPGIFIDNTTASTGTQSLHMFGALGSCWAAVATRPISLSLPQEITLTVKNGNEPFSGCNKFRATLGLRTNGPDWSDCPCPHLLAFLPNGDIRIWQGTDSLQFSGFAAGEWHHIKCHVATSGDTVTAKIWVNDIYLGQFLWPSHPGFLNQAFLDISSLEGTAWFDDICVRALDISLLPYCCAGRAGNVDCDPNNGVDISDLSALIDNLYISLAPLCCKAEANIDGSPDGNADISDLSGLIDYLYINFTLPKACQ